MDSEAEKASDDHAVLGKRKRDVTPRSPLDNSDNLDVSSQHDSRLSTATGEYKRSRVEVAVPFDGTFDHSQNANFQQKTLATMPTEILQHVCLFLNPPDLGRLLCVSQRFTALLDPQKPKPVTSGYCKILPLLTQEEIWIHSRRSFPETAPEPLKPLSELSMHRLVRGIRCQFCGCLPTKRTLAVPKSPWNAGPGPEGVRAIWPFKVRSCASCLKSRMIKEQDLMLSESSILRPGLPFALFTPSLHYVASTSLQLRSIPVGLHLSKYYFKPQISELDKQMQQLRLHVPSAYAVWYQGLQPALVEAFADIGRIEQWELNRYVTNHHEVGVFDSSSISSYSGRSGKHVSSHTASNFTSTNPSIWQYPGGSYNETFYQRSLVPKTFAATSNAFSDDVIHSTPSESQLATTSSSANRTLHDVKRIKTQRRHDIERRCKVLETPIHESDLAKLKTFKAALQIAQPLDENAWEMLKPRLIREYGSLVQGVLTESDNLSSHAPTRETVISQELEPSEQSHTNAMEESQRTTNDKVVSIARDFIKRAFMDGTNVTADTAPLFAAKVLEHVSKAFYADQQWQDAELALQGQPPPMDSQSVVRTRQLHLRHMKHVVDKCILPHTEQVQKELFLCSGCEPSEKYFPFTSLIQHYATKHTSAFSRGSRNVFWDSIWPTNPPFSMPPELNDQVSVGYRACVLSPQPTVSSANVQVGYSTAIRRSPSSSEQSINRHKSTYGDTNTPRNPSHIEYEHPADNAADLTTHMVRYNADQSLRNNPPISPYDVSVTQVGSPLQAYSPASSLRRAIVPQRGLADQSRFSRVSRDEDRHRPEGSRDRYSTTPVIERPPFEASDESRVRPSRSQRDRVDLPSKEADEFLRDVFLQPQDTGVMATEFSSRPHPNSTRQREVHGSIPARHARVDSTIYPLPQPHVISAEFEPARSPGLIQQNTKHHQPPTSRAYWETDEKYLERVIHHGWSPRHRIAVPPRFEHSHHDAVSYHDTSRYLSNENAEISFPPSSARSYGFSFPPVRPERTAGYVRSQSRYRQHIAATTGQLQHPTSFHKQDPHSPGYLYLVEERYPSTAEDRTTDAEYGRRLIYREEPQHYTSPNPNQRPSEHPAFNQR